MQVTIGFWPGLDFAVCSFSKRVATHNFWPGLDFAVCTFPNRMARVMERFATIENRMPHSEIACHHRFLIFK